MVFSHCFCFFYGDGIDAVCALLQPLAISFMVGVAGWGLADIHFCELYGA